MKKLFSILILGIFTFVSSSILADNAKVVWVKGKVEYKTSGGQWTALSDGKSIPSSAEIKTSANSRVKLEVSGKEIIVQPGETVLISSLASGDVKTASKLTNRYGSTASKGVSSVAGVRASSAVEKSDTSVFSSVGSAPQPGEMDAITKANKIGETDKMKAIETLNSFIDANPESYRAMNAVGLKLMDNGEFEKALTHFSKIVAQMPSGIDMISVFWAKMVCEQSAGLSEESNTTATSAISRYPSNPNLPKWYLIKAFNYEALGNAAAAKKEADMAKKIALTSSNALLTNAINQIGANEKSESLASIIGANKDVSSQLNELKAILEDCAELKKRL